MRRLLIPVSGIGKTNEPRGSPLGPQNFVSIKGELIEPRGSQWVDSSAGQLESNIVLNKGLGVASGPAEDRWFSSST